MLNIVFGTDAVAARARAHELVADAVAAGAGQATIDADAYAPGVLTEASESVSLFGGSRVYLIDTPSLVREFYDDVIANLHALADSSHTFVVLEAVLLAPEKKKFQKYAALMEECVAPKSERFNTFALAEALAKKDKKSLWLLLTDAQAAGISGEEIIGILWWQLKSLRLAAATNAAAEAGMKDFPYKKAKQALRNFSDTDLHRLSHELISLYHAGHAGERDLDLALERFTLTL